MNRSIDDACTKSGVRLSHLMAPGFDCGPPRHVARSVFPTPPKPWMRTTRQVSLRIHDLRISVSAFRPYCRETALRSCYVSRSFQPHGHTRKTFQNRIEATYCRRFLPRPAKTFQYGMFLVSFVFNVSRFEQFWFTCHDIFRCTGAARVSPARFVAEWL